MRILGLPGSLGARSANLTLLETAASVAPDGVEVVLFSRLGELPHFDPDAADAPASVQTWRDAIASSDALLVASPEYGHSLPGVLKNAIDWVIGSGELERKVIAITASVPAPERGRKGLAALRQTLGAVRATIVGGEPITRGPTLEPAVRALLGALVDAVRSRSDELPRPGLASAHLDRVVSWVEDPLRSLELYEGVVGLPALRADAFRAGSAPHPSVRLSAETLIDLRPRKRVDGTAPPTHLCLSMSKDDYDALRSRLEANGIALTSVTNGSLGAQGSAAEAFSFTDPDGNVLEARYY